MGRKANIVIDQGSTFETVILLADESGSDLDVTGYSARGQMRRHYTSSNAVNFTCTLANGSLTISLTAEQTADIVPGRYVYDVEIVDDENKVSRVVEGIVTVTPEVTRT